jgi:hypothetical protein
LWATKWRIKFLPAGFTVLLRMWSQLHPRIRPQLFCQGMKTENIRLSCTEILILGITKLLTVPQGLTCYKAIMHSEAVTWEVGGGGGVLKKGVNTLAKIS